MRSRGIRLEGVKQPSIFKLMKSKNHRELLKFRCSVIPNKLHLRGDDDEIQEGLDEYQEKRKG